MLGPELTRALPSSLRSVLPTVEEIEAELDEPTPEATVKAKAATSGPVQMPAPNPRKESRPPRNRRKGNK